MENDTICNTSSPTPDADSASGRPEATASAPGKPASPRRPSTYSLSLTRGEQHKVPRGPKGAFFKRRSEAPILKKYKAYLLLERGLSENTRLAYTRDVSRFLDYVDEQQLDICFLRLDDLHHFAGVLADLGISERSIARILSGVSSFCRFLRLDGYADQDPSAFLVRPNYGKHLPEVLSIDEVEALLAAVDTGHRDGVRDRAIIEMLYSCGLRVTELCTLRLSDVFMDEGYIRVTGKGNHTRLIPLSPRASEELNRWFVERDKITPYEGEEDYVFISAARRRHLSRITVFHNLRVFARRAGITKTISPHTLRHTFATHLLEGGANLRVIQLLMGHKSMSTTEMYTHLDTRFLRQQVLNCFPRNHFHDAPRTDDADTGCDKTEDGPDRPEKEAGEENTPSVRQEDKSAM